MHNIIYYNYIIILLVLFCVKSYHRVYLLSIIVNFILQSIFHF